MIVLSYRPFKLSLKAMWFVIKFFENGAGVRGVWSSPNLDSFSFDPKYLSKHYSYTLLNCTKRKPLSIPIA